MQRFIVAVFFAFAWYVGGSVPALAQAYPCNVAGITISFSNGTGTKVGGAYVLTQPVLNVSVGSKDPNSTAQWNVNGTVTDNSLQNVNTDQVTLNLDSANINVFQFAVLNGKSTVCNATYTILRLNTGTGSLAFIAPDQTRWEDKPFNVVLPQLVAMGTATVKFTGSAFQITGQLQIGKSLRSTGDVQLLLDKTGVTLTNPVALQIKPAADNTSFGTVAIATLRCPWQQHCSVSATLTLSPNVVPGGGVPPQLAMTLDRLNRWSATAAPGTQIILAGLTATVTDVKIDDSAAIGVTIDGTLSITALGSTTVTLANAGLAEAPDGTYVPVGNFTLSGSVSAGGLSISSSATTVAFPSTPDPNTIASITASGTLAANYSGDSASISISNMKIVIPHSGGWNLDLSGATTQVNNLQLFGHVFGSCDLTGLSDAEKNQILPSGSSGNSICLSMHLTPGSASLSNADLAFARFAFNVKAIAGVTQVTPASVTVVIPTTQSRTLRLGGMPLTVSDLNVQLVADDGTITEQLPTIDDPDLKTALSKNKICMPFVAGTVTLTAPSLSSISAIAGQLSNGSSTNQISATPQFAIGRSCLIVVLNGLLPVIISPQSSIIFTAVTIVHAEDTSHKQINFAQASGAITTGNITGVVRRLSYLRDDFAEKTTTHFDPDWGLTVAINAARNPNAITDTLQKAGALVLGLLVH